MRTAAARGAGAFEPARTLWCRVTRGAFGYPSGMTTVPHTARKTARVHRMLEAGCPVLLMVSGGADSVTLLHLFAAGELGEHPLRVLHVNHLLRAGHSDGDERFVLELCTELGVECRAVRYDVAAWAADEGLNLEDAGRQVRYRFAGEELDAWCEELGVDATTGRVAVAHTRDDRVETFFMRAIGGSGTGGLNALAPVRDRIVRPLVDIDRAQVRAWLEGRGAIWREDASNEDTTRSRALVRARVDARGRATEPGGARRHRPHDGPSRRRRRVAVAHGRRVRARLRPL